MGTIAGETSFSRYFKRFNDLKWCICKYVDESDVNKLARGTNTITMLMMELLEKKRASYGGSTQSCNRN